MAILSIVRARGAIFVTTLVVFLLVDVAESVRVMIEFDLVNFDASETILCEEFCGIYTSGSTSECSTSCSSATFEKVVDGLELAAITSDWNVTDVFDLVTRPTALETALRARGFFPKTESGVKVVSSLRNARYEVFALSAVTSVVVAAFSAYFVCAY